MTLEAVRPARVNQRRVAVGTAEGFLPALLAFAPVVGLAGAQGGYFPSAWGWASLPLFWAAGVALAIRRRIRLSDIERIFLVLLVVFTGWIALSTVWSKAPAASVLELERTLVYLAGVGAVVIVSRSRFTRHVLAGVLLAISCIAAFSLATRLLPDRVGVFDRTSVYRLAQPIGYWNGLALFTAMGALLALAFAARARTVVARSACAAALVLLLPTFYFTFGRAAWIALAAGIVAAVACDPRRLQLLAVLLVVAPAPALGIWLCSREPGLTHAGTALTKAAHDGHRVALALLALACLNAAAAAVFASLEHRVDVGPGGRSAFAAVIAFTVVGLLGTVFVRYGGPVELAQRGYRAFKAQPPHVSNLSHRLLSFSGNGRADLWRLAVDEARTRPMVGTGPGTYERYFLAHQPANIGQVRDAHSLYIETLAEAGAIGLVLLVAVLAMPLLAIRAARGHPLVPGAVGAYVAYLVHTGVDWDWELPAVTLAGLLCGAAILIAARRSFQSDPISRSFRSVAIALTVVAAAFAAIGLVGNSALSRSESAREHGDWVRAAEDAHRARSWMPWSPAPWVALGRAELGAGLTSDAMVSFRKAISIDRGDWQLWYYLATAASGKERRAALREAGRLSPHSTVLPRLTGSKS